MLGFMLLLLIMLMLFHMLMLILMPDVRGKALMLMSKTIPGTERASRSLSGSLNLGKELGQERFAGGEQ